MASARHRNAPNRQAARDARETANVAVFRSSTKASGMTGTTVNLTMGSLDE
jgi:hypothetical protein